MQTPLFGEVATGFRTENDYPDCVSAAGNAFLLGRLAGAVYDATITAFFFILIFRRTAFWIRQDFQHFQP
jgi:hypothetical protein